MKKTRFITMAAIIAAIYAVLSLATYTFSYLEIQCRIAEALCITIFYTPAGVWGVVAGCLITNIFGGSIIDMIFGTLATLIAAVLTRPIAKAIRRKHGPVLSIKHSLLIPIPTVLVNTIIIPFVLYFGYDVTAMGSATSAPIVLLILAFSIFAGEMISCYVFGPILVTILNKVDKSVHFSTMC
ncbi:MAG: QueT transporter family protein [Lachnospiraceae bacterium]|nr:QueT transporter family protein [Lachnospiraceae bacterium]